MAKDYSKYSIAHLSTNLNKRKLVLTVIKNFVETKNPTLKELLISFSIDPKSDSGFIQLKEKVKNQKNFQMQDPLFTKDGYEVVVSNQWGSSNIHEFILSSQILGYEIEKILLSSESVENNIDDNSISKKTDKPSSKVLITIKGRIPNYMFGVLLEDYFNECQKALNYVKDESDTIEDILRLIYNATLDSFGDGLEYLKNNIDFNLIRENCPLIFEFLNLLESGEIGYEQFYETFFDMAWKDEVNFFEGDALIEIIVDDKVVVEEQKLESFIGETDWVDEEEFPESTSQVEKFWNKHSSTLNFGEGMGVDEFTAYRAKNGVLQLNEWIEPSGLTPFKTNQRNVTFEHDYIVDFTFQFEAENLDLSKLIFLMFANATSFNQSGAEYIGSYLYYNNVKIRPDMNIIRDKGFNLYYEDSNYSCDYFIVG